MREGEDAMVYLEPGVYVRPADCDRAPSPRPSQSGFSANMGYRVLGVHAPSETSEAYFLVANDRDEIWFLSNRHFRIAAVGGPQELAVRMPLSDLSREPGSLP